MLQNKDKKQNVWFISIMVGAGISFTSFLFIFQYLPIALLFLVTLLVISAIIFSWFVSRVLGKYFYPTWLRISSAMRIFIVLTSIIFGFFTAYRSPLQPPPVHLFDNNGIQVFINSPIFFCLGLISLSVFFGFILFSIFLFLVKKDANNTKRSIFVILFLLIYLLVGLLVFDDYGVSVDEPTERYTGLVNLKFIAEKIYPDYAEYHFKDIDELQTINDKYYGIAFQLPIVVLEELNMIEGQTIWLFRHFGTFLFFFLGVVAFYNLAEIMVRDWKIALIGTVFFVLTPRLFADSFYNIKDAVFLSAFTISMFFGMCFLKKTNNKNAILFGLVSAFAANVRIISGYLVFLICGAILLEYLRRKEIRNLFSPFILFGFTFFIALFLFWPASWEKPFVFLWEALTHFANYQLWNDQVMYMGSYIWGQDPPWHYLPVWMIITIPASYLVLFLMGSIETSYGFIKKRKGFSGEERNDRLLLIFLFLFPILTAVLLKSTVYNGWRHFYFTYTPLMLVATTSLKTLVQWLHKTGFKRVLGLSIVGLIGLYQINLLGWSIKNHPYENVYFNNTMVSLFGGRASFERDYWRLSAKQGWEYILSTDDSEHIEYLYEDGAWANTLILPDADQKRLQYSLEITDNTDYYIYSYRRPAELKGKEVYSITVDGLKILSVYKLK